MSPRDAFPGYDEPVTIDCEPEEALKILLTDEPDNEGDDEISEEESDEGDITKE